MYVITNRNYAPHEPRVEDQFGGKLNTPHDELRLAVVTGAPNSYTCEVFEESPAMNGVDVPYPSEGLFQELQARMRSPKGKDVVFFVHGYNTTFKTALDTAFAIEETYGVEVILFTWPSDGKTHRYKSDKRDAIASHLALDRALERLGSYMAKHITKENACGRGFTLLLHSMGNYLFKHLFKSGEYEGETLIFDNVVLASADVNHHDHVQWVSRIQARNRIYIAINEDDRALKYSRMKFGDKQKARLGQTVRGAKATNAVYLDFSDAPRVGNDHSYFRGKPTLNPEVKKTFRTLLHGERVEHRLVYHAETGTYRIS